MLLLLLSARLRVSPKLITWVKGSVQCLFSLPLYQQSSHTGSHRVGHTGSICIGWALGTTHLPVLTALRITPPAEALSLVLKPAVDQAGFRLTWPAVWSFFDCHGGAAMGTTGGSGGTQALAHSEAEIPCVTAQERSAYGIAMCLLMTGSSGEGPVSWPEGQGDVCMFAAPCPRCLQVPFKHRVSFLLLFLNLCCDCCCCCRCFNGACL